MLNWEVHVNIVLQEASMNMTKPLIQPLSINAWRAVTVPWAPAQPARQMAWHALPARNAARVAAFQAIAAMRESVLTYCMSAEAELNNVSRQPSRTIRIIILMRTAMARQIMIPSRTFMAIQVCMAI